MRPWKEVSQLAATVIASAGFALDSYDIFWANLSLPTIMVTHPLTSIEQSILTCMTLLGAACGQVVFGRFLGSRHSGWPIVVTLLIIAASAIACITMTIPARDCLAAFLVVLCVFRYTLGFGVGGEYPLSQAIAREHTRGNKIAKLKSTAYVFAMQGVGALLTPIVFLIVMEFTDDTEIVWRATLATSIPWCLFMIYPRLKLPSTSSSASSSIQATTTATTEALGMSEQLVSVAYQAESGEEEHGQSENEESAAVLAKRERNNLIGAAVVWGLFDVSFYANGLFNASITSALHLGSSLHDKVINALILNVMALPGYFIGIYLVLRFNVKHVQMAGLASIAVLYLILGVGHKHGLSDNHPNLFLIIYGCTFLASNAGPNMTTFVLPGQMFSTANHTRYHGYAAATGKMGALLGTLLLKPILDAYGIFTVMIICVCISISGLIVTAVCIDKRSCNPCRA
jgi:PHS family inorganic phosphate transporter-like MFS transporter